MGNLLCERSLCQAQKFDTEPFRAVFALRLGLASEEVDLSTQERSAFGLWD